MIRHEMVLSKKAPCLALTGVLLISQSPSFSATVDWFSSPFAGNLGNFTSEGEPLDGAWSFHLGYFQVGFSPSAGNQNQWADNWTTLDVSSYNGTLQFFTSSWTEDGSVPDGTRGYIWGFNRNAIDQEWLLLSDMNWIFPLPPSGINPGSNVEWKITSTTESGVAVLGSVNSGGSLMTASMVAQGEPPLLSGEHWLSLHFSAGELGDSSVSGWDADPDRDNLTNLEEFAFGTGPNDPSPLSFLENDIDTALRFSVPLARNVAVELVPQVSGDLVSWDEGTEFVVVDSSTPIKIVYRDLVLIKESEKRFGRVQVTFSP